MCTNSFPLLRFVGVSKEQRGEIWAKLSEFNKSENNNINYFNILNELTRYQHSIIIDLG